MGTSVSTLDFLVQNQPLYHGLHSPLSANGSTHVNIAAASGQVRIARPTSRLHEVVAFYRDVLGLEVIDSFRDHEGFSGVMVGLPGSAVHLEFTTHEGDDADGPVGLAPTQDNLLVFYVEDSSDFAAIRDRLAAAGPPLVPPVNPYWSGIGALTFVDPDAWRVVVAPGPYQP
jgi:catechol 2,3-dioxygenase-like lactoylglutathione lyase family enzyme